MVRENDRIGAYSVVRRLATSDTAEVLLAKAEGPMGFERTVVLKVLLPHLTADQDSAGAFAREAAAYARLSDPAIVTLYEFSEHEGRLMMVLEHIDGAPLVDVLAALEERGRSLDDKTCLYVAQRIFAALATAHRAPIIHRDVNPSNVLLSWDGEVKLTDFGFARFMGATHQSAFGMIKGTFGYMAPEQIEGGAITSRTDIYAAGIVLWELLTRQTAFPRGKLSEIEALTRMAEPSLASLDELRPDLPQRLRNAVTRAIRPRSEDRDVSAAEMVSILRGLVPSDIGREKLATWLEQLRAHLDAGLDAEDGAAIRERRTSHPELPRAESRRSLPAAQAAETFRPSATTPAAAPSERSMPARTASPAESTRVMAATPAPTPPPVAAPDRPVLAQPPEPLPAPPPLLGSTASVTRKNESRGGRAVLIGLVGLALVAIAGGAVALFLHRPFGWKTAPESRPSADPSASHAASSTSDAPPPSVTIPTPTRPATETDAAVSVVPPPPSLSVPSGSASAPIPAGSRPVVPPEMTLVRTEGSSVGRRIFLDGQAVGQTPSSVTVSCGSHELRIGSSGLARRMDLPCGGEVTLTDR
ncbi:MAG: serine/threonine-protein kinase [Labilithrix sp.]